MCTLPAHTHDAGPARFSINLQASYVRGGLTVA